MADRRKWRCSGYGYGCGFAIEWSGDPHATTEELNRIREEMVNHRLRAHPVHRSHYISPERALEIRLAGEIEISTKLR